MMSSVNIERVRYREVSSRVVTTHQVVSSPLFLCNELTGGWERSYGGPREQ